MAALFAGWASDPFAEQVEKATSELLPAGQEDIALNLEICDQVRAKQVPAKHAMQIIKKRLGHKNPNVVLLSLGLTDICIKNGGDHFLAEVASREFMDNLVSILRNPAGVNMDVKSKALGLIQNWAQIAEAKPQQMSYINDTYKSLRSSGFDFPPKDTKAIVSAALVETMTAPEWIDGDVCMRCRTSFTTFNRKHHCRNCGNVFCQDCSSKTMALPWFGIGQDVRVCDGCYAKKAPTAKSNKLARSISALVAVPSGRGGAGSHHRSRTMDSGSKRFSSRVSKEEDDLALAIKLSLEASSSSQSRPGFVASQPPVKEGRPTKQADGRMLEGTDSDDDPDLAAAIAASLRDYAAPIPSAPVGLDDPRASTPRADDYHYQREFSLPLPPSLELPATDVDALLSFAHNAAGQEAYARQHGQWQPAHQQYQTQELYEKATLARPRMAKSLDEATRRHGVLISMHDKLTEAVRLYDRLLDAQLSRPSQYGNSAVYGNPPAAAAPLNANYNPRQSYNNEGHSMYTTFPQQNGNHYVEANYRQQESQEAQSSNMSYRVGGISYSEHTGSQNFASRPSFSSIEPSRDEYAAHQYNQQQMQPQQQPFDQRYQQPPHLQQPPSLEQQVPLQQSQNVMNEQPSAPPAPSTTSASPQNTGTSSIYNNHWQTLESLPSAPSNTTMQVNNGWTQLSPPSQRPAQGSLYSNMPTLPQFEDLSIQQQQQQRSFSDSVNIMTSPSQNYRHVSSGRIQGQIPRLEDAQQGWSGVTVQKTGPSNAPEDGHSVNNKSPAPVASPYSSQPWTRPLETPLIDL